VEAIMKIKRQTLGQSGASAIEFALVLPVLLVILFGIVEFSVLFYDKAMITNASREGARLAIVYRGPTGCVGVECYPPESEIITRVNDYLGISAGSSSLLISFDGSSSPGTSVSLPDGNADTGSRRQVVVTYNYGWLLLPNFATALTGPLTLTATSNMRFE
jgi:hypothetical protein